MAIAQTPSIPHKKHSHPTPTLTSIATRTTGGTKGECGQTKGDQQYACHHPPANIQRPGNHGVAQSNGKEIFKSYSLRTPTNDS
jgi:hypothetical protein